MRLILFKIVSVLIFVAFINTKAKGQSFYKIPTQILQLYQLMGYEDDYTKDTVNQLLISDLIPYKEYKKYLEAVKADSSEQFYKTQLPDTNITIDKNAYQEYITSSEYDSFPVLGISWESAMNYCKWKTLKDNNKGKIKFVYRLPYHSEWLSTLYYCNENEIDFDINDKYSDWVINPFDEVYYNFGVNGKFDYDYFHKENDPMVLKRKRVVGNSYLYCISFYSYGYSTIGYRQIAFRIVRTKKVDKSLLNYWGIVE